ncbi:MAG: hypothetical protein IKK58_06720 [Clostridia bacterium]|nr:hypothetical protein [Clostridia bacterium]
MHKILICKIEGGCTKELAEKASACGMEVRTCQDCQAAVALLNDYLPDIVVFDVVLINGDGVELLKECVINGMRSICVTSLINDSVLLMCHRYGTDFVIPEGLGVDKILERIQLIADGGLDFEQRPDIDYGNLIDKEITVILGSLGIKHGRLGFKYARMVIMEMYKCQNTLTLSKIYAQIAKMLNTKPNCIERSIRSAIEDTWTNGCINKIDEMFGYTVKEEKGKPTNKEFLSAVYELLRLRIDIN